ncbi:predicted protein [Fibroporia radiculosa]|uniref:Uncharacterized protein n=1 Tax=Fibroporia radiculosa TaxID=599839 RepID=J7RW69_9APHY|nr:predicted protein [Fibroporia radiculosa]
MVQTLQSSVKGPNNWGSGTRLVN